MTITETSPRQRDAQQMSHANAIGLAVNQQLFALRYTHSDLGEAVGLTKSTISRKIRGSVPWTAEEISLAAELFGITAADLLPTPDGNGGWIPAPYVPGYAKDPVPVGTGSSDLVAGTGFEPATSGL